MLCSTIIPTVGRASLTTTIESVINQGLDPKDLEIIVVNDSGASLPSAAWQHCKNVKIIETNRRNRSIARNVGAAASKGKYLHFLDDDDWMLPGAYASLLGTAQTSQASWTYGAFRLVDNAGNEITVISPDESGNCSIQMMAWEWLPLQASIISVDAFFAVDGFASLPSLLGGFEDVHLSRQISMLHEMARVDQVVATIRIGDVGSTTNYVSMFDQNRQSREKTLAMPNAFWRLLSSASSQPTRTSYWYGKVIYYYLASMKWNIQSKQFFTGTSRAAFGLLGIGLAGSRLFSGNFWKGLRHPHYPRMGIAIQEAGADHLYASTRQAIGLDGKKNP